MEEENRRAKRIYRGEAEWREILQQQERSGQAVASFCRANGISASLFYKASCRIKSEPKSVQGTGLGFEELLTHIVSEEGNGERARGGLLAQPPSRSARAVSGR